MSFPIEVYPRFLIIHARSLKNLPKISQRSGDGLAESVARSGIERTASSQPASFRTCLSLIRLRPSASCSGEGKGNSTTLPKHA